MHYVYIGHVEISPAIARKLKSKHGILPEEVRAACVYRTVAQWHYHSRYGKRLLVVGSTDHRQGHGRTLKVILQSVDPHDGLWRLRTAIASTRD